jgi:hypothetical protein
MVNYSFLPSHI